MNQIDIEPLELHHLLNADEISRLVDSNLEVQDHTVVTLPTARMQVSRPLDDGSVVLLLHVPIPNGLFTAGSSILQANGQLKSALDGAIVVPPMARCVVGSNRLSEEALGQFSEKLRMVAQQVQGWDDDLEEEEE
jgi:hypothetical protein